MSKTRKSKQLWINCNQCQCILAVKDATLHDQNCPPTLPLQHGYIKNNVLNTILEAQKTTDLPENVSKQELDNIVFLSESALQLCQIAIGDSVLIQNNQNFIVKKAWPMSGLSLTSACLTKNAIELDKIEGSISIKKLDFEPFIASEIIIESVGRSSLSNITPELRVLIKNYNHEHIFSVGNRLSIPYYGKRLIYKIIEIKSSEKLCDVFENLKIEENKNEQLKLYLSMYSTKWKILENSEQKETKGRKTNTKNYVIGYSKLLTDLKNIFKIGLKKFEITELDIYPVHKGVLLYGPVGIGKSMISEALFSELDVYVSKINSLEIYKKNVQDTESAVNKIFKEAFEKSPSIIYIENIDSLFSKKNSAITDNEKKLLDILIKFFDEIQGKNVMLLATTTRLDSVDNMLRRPGRLSKEFEIPVPTCSMRKEIILKLIEQWSHALSNEEIEDIAYNTHGFVNADLHTLCTEAASNAIIRATQTFISNPKKITVLKEDFDKSVVYPSAMKEVIIDVPNVKWTDIGGQKYLKLKLAQAVEWPLKKPEAFERIGISPPKGILMFGPPGCSKTMIAKALATESKLNFLNIKGPELFSKWVGDSEKAVRDLFKKARQVAPSIIFIDEIDAIGTERTASSSNAGSNVQERVLAQLLTELDGVTPLGNVTLVAATNRPDRLDKALLRPGRFDRLIYVPLPDAETRKEIFKIKVKKMKILDDNILEDLVKSTEGYSGAEIQAICQEAGMKALEEDIEAKEVSKTHFDFALSVVIPRTPKSLLKLYEEYSNQKSASKFLDYVQ